MADAAASATELLAQLRDIHLPLEPLAAMAPLAPLEHALLSGPLLALGAALVLAATLGVFIWRRWQQTPQQQALRRLAELARHYAVTADAVALAQGISALLRAQALRRYPQEQPAGLVDEAWLAFLDAHGGNGQFRHGAGAQLSALPYCPAPPGDTRAAALIALARHWLRANPV